MKLVIRLSDELYEELAKTAKERGMSVFEAIRAAIEERLRKENQ